MSFLEAATLLAYLALNVDNIVQTVHIYRRKSSLDISIFGTLLRLAAVIVIWYKLSLDNDWSVFLGHSIIAITFALYVVFVLYYRLKKPGTAKPAKRSK